MCIFCNNDVKREEKEKHYIEQCNVCKSKISIIKNNEKIFVIKFPKHDKIFNLFLFLPYLLIGYIIYLGLNKNIGINLFTRLIIIGIIIYVILNIIYTIKNLINYKKKGYIYYGLKSVITKDSKKSILLFAKIFNYSFLFFGIQFVIVMSLLLIFNKI
jgi:hypothetical protein